MLYIIATIAAIVLLEISRDWLIYKYLGRARPDHPEEENYLVITGPQDAFSQRMLDLYSKKEARASKD